MSMFQLDGGQGFRVHGLRGSAPMFHLTSLDRKCVVIAADDRAVTALADQIRSFRPETRVLLMPALDGSPLAFTQVHPSTRRTRLRCLAAILDGQWDVVVTVPKVFFEPLAPKARLLYPRLTLEAGGSYDLTALAESLTEMGYMAVDMVAQPGDFARRGGILDIYSFAREQALRLEFFDDELEEIRLFDPTTQRGIANLESASVLPVFEWIVGTDQATTFNRKGGTLWNQSTARDQFLALVAQIRDRGRFSGYLHWTALFFSEVAHFGTLFQEDTLFWVQDWDSAQEHHEQLIAKLDQQWQASTNGDHLHISAASLFGLESLERVPAPEGATVFYHRDLKLGDIDQNFVTQSVPHYRNDIRRFMEHWLPQSKRQVIVIVCRTGGMLQRLEDVLAEEGHFATRITFPLAELPPHGIYLTTGQLETGFIWPERQLVVISESDLWSQVAQPRPVKRGKRIFQSEFRDLKIGDYVVHQEQGIGRFPRPNGNGDRRTAARTDGHRVPR